MSIIVAECSGLCCAAFPIGGGDVDTYRRLVADYARKAAGEDEQIKDGALLATILRPLRHDMDGWPLYACARWDEESRACTRYDERPSMCRRYPYGHACEHCSDHGIQISTG